MTVLENITFPLINRKVPKEEARRQAEEIAKVVHLEGLLNRKPKALSGGQQQRVAIARALVKKPKLYIFDDSFSALDFKTDAALRKALAKETQDAAVLIIAQRVSSILHCDQILVLEDGVCQGLGTHEELLKSCSVYREISEIQMGGDSE